MKLKGFYKDKTPQPIEIGGATFYVKPLNQALNTLLRSNILTQDGDLFPLGVKRAFAKDHLADWEGLYYQETGSPVEYSVENAIEMMTDEAYDDLFATLYNFAFSLFNKNNTKREEDAEQAKK